MSRIEQALHQAKKNYLFSYDERLYQDEGSSAETERAMFSGGQLSKAINSLIALIPILRGWYERKEEPNEAERKADQNYL